MKDKPILIDALHITMGGGLMILNHLVDNLIAQEVDFVLLKDTRCPVLRMESDVSRLIVLSADNKTRSEYYASHRDDFHSILCFGNIPPAMKMPAPVFTYIHNVNLLKIPSDYSLKVKLLSYLKKIYIRHYASNTDVWIVQTSNTASLVKKFLAKANQPVLKFPFYHIPAKFRRMPIAERSDYIFVGDYTNAKGHDYLVRAWERLGKLGMFATLHLTVTDPAFALKIEKSRQRGANIINHGYLPFDRIIELYNQCKATVYPSLNESLGLGIIEAAEAGCDVIGCDLPYIHSVCKPSEIFQPRSASAIVEAVLRYDRTAHQKTLLTIQDEVKPFIQFLQDCKID